MATRFDLTRLAPSDLPALDDAQFRQVVDADLRRRVNPNILPERASNALRGPDNLRRWHSQLLAIKRSVDGQLVAAKDELDAVVGTIEARIAQLEDLRPGSPQISVLRSEVAATRSEYLRKKAGRERFLTGVEEHIVFAERLLSSEREDMYNSVVTVERDRYARRLRRLERAVRDHRDVIMADLEDGEEPDECDLALWGALDSDDD
jgi:hypothetical protein